MPVVQMLTRLGTPQNANTPWKHFWQGYPPNTQQNSPGILTGTKLEENAARH